MSLSFMSLIYFLRKATIKHMPVLATLKVAPY